MHKRFVSFAAYALTLVALTTVLSSCDAFVRVPKGRIRVKNDLSGSEYSSYSVSGGGASYYLRAGESATLPARTYSFSISYQARDGHRSYTVQCPSNSSLGITVRLIDVHTDRISGGCSTVGGSHER